MGIAGQGRSYLGKYTMNKTSGIQLALFSLVLAGLSYLTYSLAPSLSRSTLIAGLAGGGLCLVWGLRAIAASPGKALPILTLIPVNFMLLAQMIRGFLGQGEAVSGRQAATVVVTLVFVISMGMLTRIAYAGVEFEGQATSLAKDGTAKPQASNKPVLQGYASKRA